MDDENLYRTKFFPQPPPLFPEDTPDRWQKIDDHLYGRQKAANDVNGMELHQLNLQVLWRPAMLPSLVRPHRIPMFKIRNLSRRPQAVIKTLASIRGVHRKKEVVKNRRRVQIKQRRLEIVTGELNAEFDTLFSRSGITSSGATLKDDIEGLSSKTSRMNITTLE